MIYLLKKLTSEVLSMKNKKLVIGVIIAVGTVLAIIVIIGNVIFNKAEVIEDVPDGNSATARENSASIENEKENIGEGHVATDPNGSVIDNKEVEEIKFDEEDLKSKIGTYLIYENFMQDFYVGHEEDENVNIVDYANEAKVLIGYSLVVFSDLENDNKPTEEEVRKAIEEYCGEHYEKYIDTAECWIAFDGDNSYDFVEVGDYDASGYCNEIEKIEKGEDGKYTVTFVYSRPSDWDFIEGTPDKVQKFKKQFTFVYHPDAKYTKYQLTELSFLKGEEVYEEGEKK